MNIQRLRLPLALLVSLLAALLPLGAALADVGPKPTIAFYFQPAAPGDPLTITSGVLLQCQTADCQDAAPLPGPLGPQHFSCEALACDGLSYGFSDYGQLEITFSDGSVRKSNVFAIKHFNSVYDVTINPGSLLVKEHFDPTALIIGGVCLSLIAIAGVILFLVARKVLRRPAQS